MEKILVCVEVPAIKQKFDVKIPVFLQTKEVISLLTDAIEELSEHFYISSGHELLCHKQRHYIFQKEATFEDYGVLNGDHLMLI